MRKLLQLRVSSSPWLWSQFHCGHSGHRYTLRNVNGIYVNCTSINTCTIFKIQKNTSWMQLLLRHDCCHVDLSPSTSHVNSFHNCSVLPHIFSPRSSHSSSFKKSVQIMSPRCSEPFSASCPPNSFRTKSLQWRTRPPNSWPHSCWRVSPSLTAFLLLWPAEACPCFLTLLCVSPWGSCTSSSFCLGISRKLWPSSEVSQR